MQIFLKTATRKTAAFEVESNHTMENVKAKIYNEEDFLPGRQHKILTVKQFKDGRAAPPSASKLCSQQRIGRGEVCLA